MITFDASMFLGSNPCWQKLYADCLAWCSSGIAGLESSNVHPFHVAIKPAYRTDKRKVVYALFDQSTRDEEPCHCFFEDDYVEGFARFSAMNNVTLWVAYLAASSTCPIRVWHDNSDFISEHHGNALHWNANKKSWFV